MGTSHVQSSKKYKKVLGKKYPIDGGEAPFANHFPFGAKDARSAEPIIFAVLPRTLGV
jgi:hypothetical protein